MDKEIITFNNNVDYEQRNPNILMSSLGQPTVLGNNAMTLGETFGDESDDVVVVVNLLQQLLLQLITKFINRIMTFNILIA